MLCAELSSDRLPDQSRKQRRDWIASTGTASHGEVVYTRCGALRAQCYESEACSGGDFNGRDAGYENGCNVVWVVRETRSVKLCIPTIASPFFESEIKYSFCI